MPEERQGNSVNVYEGHHNNIILRIRTTGMRERAKDRGLYMTGLRMKKQSDSTLFVLKSWRHRNNRKKRDNRMPFHKATLFCPNLTCNDVVIFQNPVFSGYLTVEKITIKC